MVNLQVFKANLERVREEIAGACAAAGRKSEEITLVAVTKGHPAAVLEAAVEAGLRHIGENYPEETREKLDGRRHLPELCLHMIGHLQSRKIPILIDLFDRFDALDSLRLANKLQDRLSAAGKELPVLLEVNAADEESKQGWPIHSQASWPQVIRDFETIACLPNLKIQGLMTMPPLDATPAESRAYFHNVFAFREVLRDAIPGISFAELSMGTSHDYPAAIAEGATMVRLGTVLFGPREQG